MSAIRHGSHKQWVARAPDISKTVDAVKAIAATNLLSPATPATCPEVSAALTTLQSVLFTAFANSTGAIAILDSDN